jgi:hypothetical protein
MKRKNSEREKGKRAKKVQRNETEEGEDRERSSM